MVTRTIRLGEIAYARSGDKGSSATLGIFAYTGEGYRYLAEHLTEVINQKNIYKLYQTIYQSKVLNQLNESFEYGHTSLKYHLLLIANLVRRDYLHGKLDSFLSCYVAEFS